MESSHFDYTGLSALQIAKVVYFGEAYPGIIGQSAPTAPEIIARCLEEAGVSRRAALVEVDYTRIEQLCLDASVQSCVIPRQVDRLFSNRFWGEHRSRPLSVEYGIEAVGARADGDDEQEVGMFV